MASMCSLAQHTAEGWSTTFVGAQIGSDAMETWSRGLERFNSARAKYDSAQFYDVDYRDLIADPLGTVADVYRHFDLTLTDEARKAMGDIHAESQTGARAPKHRYSLADYGLTVETVKERFAGL
jgi:Sulfotransferase family